MKNHTTHKEPTDPAKAQKESAPRSQRGSTIIEVIGGLTVAAVGVAVAIFLGGKKK